MPAISLIIPVYNREKFVAAAIGSVLRQSEKDFEVVVWDDGSTDNSVEVARRAIGGDPRFRIVQAEHSGLAKTTNAAARLLTGQYMGVVDSDDAITPTALDETRAFLDAHPDVGVVYSDYITMDEQGKLLGPGSRTKIPYSKDRLLIDFMTFHFRLIRRELFSAVGGLDESMITGSDYDLCLRLSEVTKIEHLAKPLYLYRVHKQTVSSGKRLEQIMESKAAIERALKRRGMDRQYEVDVELIGKFRLNKKA